MTKHECNPGSTPVSGVGEGVSPSHSLISEVRFGKTPKPTDETSALPRHQSSLFHHYFVIRH
jgi:hypothetical protein